MQIKTAKLTGFALCWAVSEVLALGHSASDILRGVFLPDANLNDTKQLLADHIVHVEREMEGEGEQTWWAATRNHSEHGPTFTIAVCRAAVGERFGREVTVPDELAG